MNEYRRMIDRQMNEVNAFPIGAAFSKKQFKEMMNKWGLDEEKDTDKVIYLYAGTYLRKCDVPAWLELCRRQGKELKDAIAADVSGEGFIFEMFLYELDNHEYGYTGNVEEALEALGITFERLKNNEALQHGLKKATDYIMRRRCGGFTKGGTKIQDRL